MREEDVALRKAFEQTTVNNVKAVVEHSNETRKMVRELEGKITGFERTLLVKEKEISLLKSQVAFLQQQRVLEGSE